MILTTWNMQGGSASTEVKWQTGVADMLTNSPTPPAVICLQEVGGVPTSALLRATVTFADPFGGPTSVEVYDWGGTEREPGRTIVYHHWDTPGNRVNTAVVSRDNLPHPAHVALVWGNAPPVWRPAVGVLDRNMWFFSFHAISPDGADAPPVLAQVAAFSGGSHWRVGGDFNREPATWAAGLLPANSVVCPPNVPTHRPDQPTSRYDYFVRDGNAAVTGRVNYLIHLSDHWPVNFTF